MTLDQHEQPAAKPVSLGLRIEQRIRALPIRWRIFAIAGLNTAVVLLLAALIWDGAQGLTNAWNGLRQARESDRLLVSLESDTVRLQSLIHRYFNQPQPELLAEIVRRRAALLDSLNKRAAADPALAGSVSSLTMATERFVGGFDALRAVRDGITRAYQDEVLAPAREMAGLYAIIEGATKGRESLIWPSLSKSRDAFSESLVAANAYFLSPTQARAEAALNRIEIIERTSPVMRDLAENDLQRDAVKALDTRAAAMHAGLEHLAREFAAQSTLLRESIDGNQAAMVAAIDILSQQVRAREARAQEHFSTTLSEVYLQVALVAGLFLLLVIFIGIAVASSISAPLRDLRATMLRIVSGDLNAPVLGLKARDEIGEMARAVEVFRENAVARRRAEGELRASKEHAENALSDLRETQRNLIEAEKLAALGGLVAGVAHEVNNPVGISLTVASSLARRCDAFATELKEGQLRRARLNEFVDGTREASNQLVLNLQRAGELIQSFKQVAVDRSHETRRQFDLRESTEQIVASLRPGLKKAHLALDIDVPAGILLDSYPGAYGQVLTNLVLNAATHAFPDGRDGTLRIDAHAMAGPQVEISFIDDGVGMTEDVQRRAFDPFFTTRRNYGGTGLGLHIVYNLVTRRLGGRIALASAPNRGTTFRIVLPLVAPPESPATEADMTIATDR
ncbi:MAG: ATP-binding protein [Variibacter sp.]